MQLIRDLSIRSKLLGIILGTTISALLIGFVVMVWFGVRLFKRDLVNQTRAMAQVVSGYSEVELDFLDTEAASRTLARLDTIPDLEHADLYDQQGQLFAAYPPHRRAAEPPDLRLGYAHYYYANGRLHVIEPIFSEGERTGSLHLCLSTTGLQHRITRFLVVVTLLVSALIGLASIAAVKLQALISAPILELAAVARRISHGGDYSVRVHKAGNDEVGALFDAWNQMLEQIENRQLELERFATELQRSNRELDQFAYAVSHDLRAPLRAISNLSTWIEEDLAETAGPETRHHLDLMRGRTRRMEGLINAILEYSRAGRVDSSITEVDVRELLIAVITDLDPPASFTLRITGEMPTLRTSEVLLAQVLANLIGNSIKHHDRHDGLIEIHSRDLGSSVELSVTDDGPGIAAEHHDRIFDMFQTLASRDRVESTGVGLALVKKIVDDQGGMLQVKSTVGQGATFLFTWPKESVQRSLGSAATAEEQAI